MCCCGRDVLVLTEIKTMSSLVTMMCSGVAMRDGLMMRLARSVLG